MRILCFLLIVGVAQGVVAMAQGAFVDDVHKAALAGDFPAAEQMLKAYRTANGTTPEYIEAFSWIGYGGQLAPRHFDAAAANAAAVRKLCAAELVHRNLDAEPHLPIALGAAIEVDANVLVEQQARDQAVVLLRTELKRWQATSIQMRLQKNLNLLTLEGKPAPALDISQWIGVNKPKPLTAHAGHPVLLFLWALWCVDCKAVVAILQQLMAKYGSQGLVVVAPTQHYGYVAAGAEASRSVETKYIEQIFHEYYAPLGSVEIPAVSEANFARFGVSTTPTLVLIGKSRPRHAVQSRCYDLRGSCRAHREGACRIATRLPDNEG